MFWWDVADMDSNGSASSMKFFSARKCWASSPSYIDQDSAQARSTSLAKVFIAMDGTLSEDDGLIRDSHMDLNDSITDPRMALAFTALGVELNTTMIPTHLLHMETAEVGEPTIGMEFDSDEAAKEYYVAYATCIGFGVRMNKSRRSRKDDTVIMRRFVCTREGFHSKRVIYDDGKKKRKRGTTREGCMAMIEVIRKGHGKWVVTKLITDHTHMVAIPSKVRPRVDRSMVSSNASLLHGESKQYILKRWTRNATSNVVLDERVVDSGLSFQEYLVAWYNDLCLDAVKYGMEGATSAEVYKVAKNAIQKAFAEVVGAKNMQRKGQQNNQRFARMQKMQYKMPLPKLQPKKTSSRVVQHEEAGRSKRNAKEDMLDANDPDLNGGAH
ncbi:uncharacterized protein A4U43_C03F28830 [Asparagus officinalis]|uniref:FAR1 domain-containing protein n=1 Tax=Asparagus officinalis TaxID=4686 RepID=A0A5P1FGH7_ASPOF|nr:uncharacterized protein A4U43_C03F28830 [Asparagus officinalis]